MIGCHLSKDKTIYNTLTNFITQNDHPLPACQMFLRNPRGGKSSLTLKDIAELKDLITSTSFSFYVHAPYVINLSNPKCKDWALDMLCDDLKKCSDMGGKGVVVHVGKHLSLSVKEGLDLMEKNIRNVLNSATTECPLLLETPAGEGTELCFKYDDFKEFTKRFQDDPRFGVCIDTCHVFAANHDPLDYIQKWLQDNPCTLKLIHFNDSKKCKGSRVDRHANIGSGHIGLETLLSIAELSSIYNIDMVRE